MRTFYGNLPREERGKGGEGGKPFDVNDIKPPPDAPPGAVGGAVCTGELVGDWQANRNVKTMNADRIQVVIFISISYLKYISYTSLVKCNVAFL